MTRERYIAAKFGGTDHARRIYQTVTDVGAAVGIPFHFERITVTPNTRDAHRLIRYAAGKRAPGWGWEPPFTPISSTAATAATPVPWRGLPKAPAPSPPPWPPISRTTRPA